MLKRLIIQNYALIDSLDISFPGNLVIITGETGAGKSILLGALSLLLGTKADVSVLKDKNSNCVVEAEFAGEQDIILRRVVTPQGRSRIFMNDEPVSMDELKEVSSRLIDIHAQHQQLLLADRKFQMAVLDHYAHLAEELRQYTSDYDRFTAIDNEIRELELRLSESEKNREYIEYQYGQLNDAKLIDGELEELEAEQKQLSNSEQIKANISAIEDIYNSEEFSVLTRLKEIESLLDKMKDFIPEFDQLSQRVSSARIELRDIESDVVLKGEKISSSPERLQAVDDRLAMIYDLFRKHGVSTIAELIEIKEKLSVELGRNVDLSNEKESLQKKYNLLKDKCSQESESIHNKRIEYAPRLSATIMEAIRSLEMPQALFKVEVVSKNDWGRDGKDDVLYYFSANGGVSLKELSKCASGGELSRIMLCIKALMAKYVGMPSMIFDEIDTGVSGSIADKMGNLIGEMGKHMQVFAITHLPQVASKGTAHYLVYKEITEHGEARSNIKAIDGEARVMEIARMLSGAELTPEAIANAGVLLRNN